MECLQADGDDLYWQERRPDGRRRSDAPARRVGGGGRGVGALARLRVRRPGVRGARRPHRRRARRPDGRPLPHPRSSLPAGEELGEDACHHARRRRRHLRPRLLRCPAARPRRRAGVPRAGTTRTCRGTRRSCGSTTGTSRAGTACRACSRDGCATGRSCGSTTARAGGTSKDHPVAAEVGYPAWQLGFQNWTELDDGTLAYRPAPTASTASTSTATRSTPRSPRSSGSCPSRTASPASPADRTTSPPSSPSRPGAASK